MVSPEIRKKYIATIGIECHVQLKTETKLFAAVGNDAREAPPNTLISHICLGMPGALPVLNEKAIELASRAAFALGSRPQNFSKFDRKHYFYPDLPKGYQITQFDQPIIIGGSITIETSDGPKTIHITRAHLEEDAGKSTHPVGRDYSLVDLNRAGTPLLEIVSEPEINTPEEAKLYAYELYLRMRYADVSDANLYYGNMRFDVNVSVSKTKDFGIRTETKNLNSFRSVERAVAYEIERQIEILEKGGSVTQETRGWDDSAQKTFSQRSKEDAHDYRYFPDPDIPPVQLSKQYIDDIQASMPTLPPEYRQKFITIGLDKKVIEDIIAVPEIAKIVARITEIAEPTHARRIAFWLLQAVDDNNETAEENAISCSEEALIGLSEMVESNKLSSSAAKEVFLELIKQGGDPESIAQAKNILQVSNEAELEAIVRRVIADNQKAAQDIRDGQDKAIGFLVGQVMKQSQGKANPAVVQTIIRKLV